jgi:hypothetical protein
MWKAFQLYLLRGQRLNFENALAEAAAKGDREAVVRTSLQLAQTNIRIAEREARFAKKS